MAIGDLNGDGQPDLAIANYGSNSVSVLLSTMTPGATTPSYTAKTDFTTGTGPYAVAIGDLNGDGRPDLAIANAGSASVSVLLSTTTTGAATPSYAAKTDFTTGTNPVSVAIGDLSGDGRLDLAIANRDSDSVSVLLSATTPGATTPSFAAKTDFTTGIGPRSVAIGDLNGDGQPDLAIANSASVSVLLNTTVLPADGFDAGPKTEFISGESPVSVAIGDLNGDGRPDLAITNEADANVSLLLSTMTPGATTPSYAAKTDFATGDAPRAVAIGDLNGDGQPDLAIANSLSASVSVLLNTTVLPAAAIEAGPKTDFTTGVAPRAVAIGDLNGDGRPDLAIANEADGNVSVLLNTTTPGATTPSYAAKTDFTTGDAPFAVAIGDLNGDGRPDLAIANSFSDSVSVLLNTTTPGATTPSYAAKTDFATAARPYSVAIGDLNGDGRPDLAIANGNSNSVSVLLNTTTPGATTPSYDPKTDFSTGAGPSSVAIGDLNGDGRPDLAIANYSNSVSVLLSTTSPGATTPSYAAKTDFTTGTTPYSVAIGDLNGDGRPDLAIANYSNSVSVLLSTTTPGATMPSYAAKTDFTTGASPYSVAIGDLNGDGRPDLAIANRDSKSVSVLLSTTTPGATTPSYAAKTDFTTETRPISVAIADLNGDGRPDLAIANSGSDSVSVLLNIAATISDNQGVGTIENEDVNSVASLTINDPSVTEGDSGSVNLDFTVTRSGDDTLSEITVAYTTSNNTATAGIDYMATNGTVTIASGQTTATISVPVLGDTNVEPNEQLFVNLTGITNVTGPTATLAAQTDFTTGTRPSSVAIGDLNGDGRPDLAIANASSNSVSVLLNTTPPGATTPSYADRTDFTTGDGPLSVAIGDLNGDGQPDLAIANSGSNTVTVLLNTTTPGATTPSYAAKTDFSTGDVPFSVAIGDLNDDGKPDLAIANQADGNVSVLLNTTTPAATMPSYAAKIDFATGDGPLSVAIGDLNGDGQPELVIANEADGNVSVLLNTTTPGATTPSYAPKSDFRTGTSPSSVAIGDLNGDGQPDLAIANYGSNTVSVLLNTTTPGATAPSYAAKTDFPTGDRPNSVAIGDLNGDGQPDLAIANYGSNTVSVLLSTTTPEATTPSYAAKTDFTTRDGPLSVAIGDLNGNGRPDLAIANGDAASVSVLLNNNAATISDNQGTGTINDNDTAQVTVNDVSAAEGGGLTFTVGLDNAVAAPFTVAVTLADVTATGGAALLVSPEDYDNVVAVLSFDGTAGETRQFTVATLDDGIVESSETFTVSLDASDPLITDSDTGTGTITDNDGAAVTVDDVSAVEGGGLTFTVGLDNAVAAPFTVAVTLADVTATGGAAALVSPEDYDNVVAVLSFDGTAGETRQFTVATLDDGIVESSETFTVSLDASDPLITDSDTGTGTITDNDFAASPTVQISPAGPGGSPDPDDLPSGEQPSSWSIQRSIVREIVITFDVPITNPTASDLVLTNLGVNAPVDPDTVIGLRDNQLTLSANGQELRISLDADQMSDGVYQLEMSSAITGGDPFTFTGNAVNRFFVLTGDWNGTGGVNIQDFGTFAYWFGNSVPTAPEYVDVNGSSGVNVQDFSGFAANFGVGVVFPGGVAVTPGESGGEGELASSLRTLLTPTDVNGDGSVTARDALNVINQVDRNVTNDVDAAVTDGWSKFDVNRDGQITSMDARVVIDRLIDSPEPDQAVLAPVSGGEGEQVVAADAAVEPVLAAIERLEEEMLLAVALLDPTSELAQPLPPVTQCSVSTQDAYINQDRPTENRGGNRNLRTETAPGKGRRGLTAFDVTSIPPNSNVIDATLFLFEDNHKDGQTIDVHRVTDRWTESRVTWETSSESTPWTTPGGDFDEAVIASFAADADGVYREIDVTGVTQDWVDGTSPNYGLLLRSTGPNGEVKFKSREEVDPNKRPQLCVTYELSPSVTADLSVTTQGSETGPVDIVYTVTLSESNDTGAAITFDLDDLGSGTATAGVDYTAIGANAQISVAAGASTGTLTVAVAEDALLEAIETVIAQISNPSNDSVTIGTASATASITDNFAGVIITESNGSTDVTEDGVTDTYSVVLARSRRQMFR